MAVTDHDTTAGIADVTAAAAARGIQVVPGIEITAVEDGGDVHVLGYFFDAGHPVLGEFLMDQRQSRVTRAAAIGERLASLGMPVDVQAILRTAGDNSGRSIGRPLFARAMVAAGYVADTRDAFDRWLARGRPAFVPRGGAPVATVVDIIHRAGGLASLAHPGKAGHDERIPRFVDAGLDAIEVFHSDHDAEMTERYLRLAGELRVLITGGSDFHGDPSHGLSPGSVTLPDEHWRRLQARASNAAR